MLIGHQKQWNFLKRKFELNQLSHAYLFSGTEEIGKRTFALEFVKLIMSENANKEEKCQSCKLIEKGGHPDLLVISPKNDSEIQISKIREVQQFLKLKPYYSPFKAVIIDQAEKMGKDAQSCFLKTLEEPKGQTILILISSKPEMLLPTILSRCQMLKFFIVGLSEIKNYLIENKLPPKKAEMLANVSDGKPGRAIKFLLEPDKIEKEKKILDKILAICDSDLALKFQYVKNLEAPNFNNIIELFKRYFRQLLFFKIGINNFIDFNYFPPPSEKMKSYSLTKIKEIIRLADLIDFRITTTNANPKLALEVLLLEI
ncbi:DNA polymerase III subunit delta' [Patescibacteria group bacterium]|nr:DNA polymerase III subunit delta' [Patescibacteria group bacterium]MBU4367917.1 DNA polymerase III subunit delta' [Patescibacteria group bacterium]MBU4461906.1 DNA polymerase III subunit delta' [Patescibacteria group bacterium]MCG2699849.1 DNA polymerase III subunit delta' [Candidatus Parcubacteria bacterium]